MSKKAVFLIIFFSVLVIGFFIAITYFIPSFGKPFIKPISKVEQFSFINQDGKTVTEEAIQGKVVAVNFFFTTCKGICPKMNNNLKSIYQKFQNEPGVLLLSHTSDPERDSAVVLKHFADSLGVDTNKWIFLTGRKDSLYSAARHIYKIDDPQNFVQDINDDFLHTQFVALVNKKGHVVQIFDGLKQAEMKELEQKIQALLQE